LLPQHADYSRATAVVEDEPFDPECIASVLFSSCYEESDAAYVDFDVRDGAYRAYRPLLLRVVGDAVMGIERFRFTPPRQRPLAADEYGIVVRCDQPYRRVADIRHLTPVDADVTSTLSYVETVDGIDVFRGGDVIMIRSQQFGYVLK
jgi:hypothetical protein